MAQYNVAANPVSLGKLAPTSGTAIRITTNVNGAYGNTQTAEDLYCNSLEIKAALANTGQVFIGSSTMNKTTLVGVIKVLDPGDDWTLTGSGMNTLWTGTYFIDVATTGDYANAIAIVV